MPGSSLCRGMLRQVQLPGCNKLGLSRAAQRGCARSCAGHMRHAGPDTLHGAQMLEPIFGWDLFKGRPKLGAYFAAVQADPVGARVRAPTHEKERLSI